MNHIEDELKGVQVRVVFQVEATAQDGALCRAKGMLMLKELFEMDGIARGQVVTDMLYNCGKSVAAEILEHNKKWRAKNGQ